jgi:heme exporter protein C
VTLARSKGQITISAVQLLIYVSYIMLRAASESPERKARFAAIYGIVAFATVPLSWFAIR